MTARSGRVDCKAQTSRSGQNGRCSRSLYPRQQGQQIAKATPLSARSQPRTVEGNPENEPWHTTTKVNIKMHLLVSTVRSRPQLRNRAAAQTTMMSKYHTQPASRAYALPGLSNMHVENRASAT